MCHAFSIEPDRASVPAPSRWSFRSCISLKSPRSVILHVYTRERPLLSLTPPLLPSSSLLAPPPCDATRRASRHSTFALLAFSFSFFLSRLFILSALFLPSAATPHNSAHTVLWVQEYALSLSRLRRHVICACVHCCAHFEPDSKCLSSRASSPW